MESNSSILWGYYFKMTCLQTEIGAQITIARRSDIENKSAYSTHHCICLMLPQKLQYVEPI